MFINLAAPSEWPTQRSLRAFGADQIRFVPLHKRTFTLSGVLLLCSCPGIMYNEAEEHGLFAGSLG